MTPSIRDYFDNRFHPAGLGPDDFVNVPTAFAVFGHNFVSEGEPPREFMERLYRVEQWTVMHFAAVEEPELLAEDLRSFLMSL